MLTPRRRGAVGRLTDLDCRLFTAVARSHVPWLDRGLPLLSRSANHSLLWLGVAGGLTFAGGPRARRAAVRGIGSIALTSLTVNQGVKRLVRRPRPVVRDVPAVRRVAVAPLTTSFPSGHAASAAAFATGVAAELPAAGAPLAALAAAVGASRVYAGVHYPLDVAVGAAAGAAIARLTCRIWPVLPRRADDAPPSADRRAAPAGRDGADVAVVINRGSGSSGAADDVRRRLPRARIAEVAAGDGLGAALRDAAEAAAVLGVWGGDGSATAAAELALERSRPLLVLPGGTLNHLARDLRLPAPAAALDALAAGEAVGVDVATIDGRPFLNTAGFGAYAELLRRRERLEHRLGRWPAQALALAWTVLRARPRRLTIDGEPCDVWMGFVGNCRHEPDGFAPSWRPRLDDGRLDVRLLLAGVPFARQRLALAILSGRLPRSRAYRRRLVRRLEVRGESPALALVRDGECFEGAGAFAVCKLERRVAVYARHEPATR